MKKKEKELELDEGEIKIDLRERKEEIPVKVLEALLKAINETLEEYIKEKKKVYYIKFGIKVEKEKKEEKEKEKKEKKECEK